MPSTWWTEDRTEMLRKLWAIGVSFSGIAEKLGATRCAVGGKIHRMELVGPGTYRRRTDEQIVTTKREKADRRNERRRSQRVIVVRIPPVNLEALRCVEVSPQHKILVDLDAGGCRYPFGDGPYTFCNHAQIEGSSYCGPHMALSRRGTS